MAGVHKTIAIRQIRWVAKILNCFPNMSATPVLGRMPNFYHLAQTAKLEDKTPSIITEKKKDSEPLIHQARY